MKKRSWKNIVDAPKLENGAIDFDKFDLDTVPKLYILIISTFLFIRYPIESTKAMKQAWKESKREQS